MGRTLSPNFIVSHIQNIINSKNEGFFISKFSKNGQLLNSFLLPINSSYNGRFLTSLDKNDFSSIRIGFNKVELDFSNYFNINIEKKIKCEALKQEIIPIYLYNTVTGNYRYVYENKEMINGQYLKDDLPGIIHPTIVWELKSN